MESLREICREVLKKTTHEEHSSTVLQNTELFLKMTAHTEAFTNKKPLRVVPLYSHDIEDAAYYEIWFTEDGTSPSGWVTISVTNDDLPFLSFSLNGKPYSQRVLSQLEQQEEGVKSGQRIYRYNAGYYSCEDAWGNKLADYGTMPGKLPLLSKGVVQFQMEEGMQEDLSGRLRVPERRDLAARPVESLHFRRIDTYDDLKLHSASKSCQTLQRKSRVEGIRQQFSSAEVETKALPAMAGSETRQVTGTKTYHTQIAERTGYNLWPGKSGCNNNAWLNIYCWWEINQGKTNLIPNLGAASCPTNRDTPAARDIVDPIQIWLGTRCGTDAGGNTEFWDAWQGIWWAITRGYIPTWQTQYSWPEPGGGNIKSILYSYLWNNKLPVHVGYGNHFGVGVGIMRLGSGQPITTWVELYPGWQTNDNDNFWLWYGDINSVTGIQVNP